MVSVNLKHRGSEGRGFRRRHRNPGASCLYFLVRSLCAGLLVSLFTITEHFRVVGVLTHDGSVEPAGPGLPPCLVAKDLHLWRTAEHPQRSKGQAEVRTRFHGSRGWALHSVCLSARGHADGAFTGGLHHLPQDSRNMHDTKKRSHWQLPFNGDIPEITQHIASVNWGLIHCPPHRYRL